MTQMKEQLHGKKTLKQLETNFSHTGGGREGRFKATRFIGKRYSVFENKIQNTQVLCPVNEQRKDSRQKGLAVPSHHLV